MLQRTAMTAAAALPFLLIAGEAAAQAQAEPSAAGWSWLVVVLGGPILLGLAIAFAVIKRRRDRARRIGTEPSRSSR